MNKIIRTTLLSLGVLVLAFVCCLIMKLGSDALLKYNPVTRVIVILIIVSGLIYYLVYNIDKP